MEEIKLKTFLADFNLQIETINHAYSLLEENQTLSLNEPISRQLVESIGYWIHNLYSGFEDLFKLVCAFWENNIHSNQHFHKRLLERMRTSIEGVRPALISMESYQHLDEIRGFRHVFRHAYSYGLDDECVLFLLRRVLKNKDIILSDFANYKQLVKNIDNF
ncbi:MAG: hypothetical protein OMM_10543 [Candidatus Magnetoglobus multicellularis str. Araruama]|uniref:HepT-like domain-containing protein n=1 Tax=Candidatus Magnetoglobus multicellularis str. Araruama TaxID=890399 RepID=A0A1V1P0T0_9BACT|nr:MAG: hypothetical protein OMM_10543 [Candidatus Magnetoglobus multicellularis str. Araruama]